MSDIKHTPWATEAYNGTLNIVEDSKFGHQIARMAGSSEDPKCIEKANIMAAAPDLLEALVSAFEEAKERDEDMGANCWPQVAAAISKARGESA